MHLNLGANIKIGKLSLVKGLVFVVSKELIKPCFSLVE